MVPSIIPTEPSSSIPMEEVCNRVMKAVRFILVDHLGTHNDCGSSPFCDDTPTSRDTAYAKIRARVSSIVQAAGKLGTR